MRGAGVNLWDQELSTPVKHKIEKHWRDKLQHVPFDENSDKQKYYVLSMFPYPSGQLHMGHVRVYSIADAIARFHRMRGQNVLQPMGWDAFGLPAENAARDRSVDPDRWTQSNIAAMKEHMEHINFSMDWNREFASCDSDYYKWTQFLFLKLYENDMVYRREATVNWDPVDLTVLAHEQVDSSGRSWRSGAKVEKRSLKQWFIRTTRYSKALYDGLNDPELKDWRDVVKLQKHWIGECKGTNFDLEVVDADAKESKGVITVWMENPEYIDQARFVAIRPKSFWDTSQKLFAKNPFTLDALPIYVSEDLPYAEGCDTYVGIPHMNETDDAFALSQGLAKSQSLKPLMAEDELLEYRKKICKEARRRGIGGWPTSSKLKDWLISRQRYWGTPIPMIHCDSCGVQPVPESDLPVKLPPIKKIVPGKNPLADNESWLKTACPKCGNEAKRETDTMDTFVDSSWYYLRFLDPDNLDIPFDPVKSHKFMPVDVYVGGKEHAVLHLYYSRFFSHFLHSAGLLPEKEPFKRLLVQGMVRGKTFRSKSGEYIKPDLVEVDKKTARHKETNEVLTVGWEKMSKSKFNGVDPKDMFEEFGCDTTRLLILANVAPTSSRNWSRDTFPGILGWQHRLWLTVQDFIKLRMENLVLQEKSDEYLKQEEHLLDSRNFFVKLVTFNFIDSYQLSVAISKMQGLSNSIRRSNKDIIVFSEEYEKALAALIVMLCPVAPHFAAELWSGFISAPNRISKDIMWDIPINRQPWPRIDINYNMTLNVNINGKHVEKIKVTKEEFDKMTHQDALRLARTEPCVSSLLKNVDVSKTVFTMHKHCTATLRFYFDEVYENEEKHENDDGDAGKEETILTERMQ